MASPTRKNSKIFIPIILVIIGCILAIIRIVIATIPNDPAQPINPPDAPLDEDTANPPEVPITPEFIDLQPTVDNWLASTNRQVGLLIYDLDNERPAATYNQDQIFNVASIYKLFFVYNGYAAISSDPTLADQTYITTYDYRAGTYTFAECLNLMVRESYNGCADPMRSNTESFTKASDLARQLNLSSQAISSAGLYASAADLTALLKLYWQHPNFSEELWSKFTDSMLNQPPTQISADTIYDWRRGLPAGFSNQTKVYDKVGWAWNGSNWSVYADAGFLEFPTENRHYSFVVLTKNFNDAKTISNLGSQLEATILSSD